MKPGLRAAGVSLLVGALALLGACAGSPTPGSPARMTPAAPPVPPSVTAPLPFTPTPGLVEVTLGSASDSPYLAFFAVYNVTGEMVYQTSGVTEREYKLHLPPGEYRWTANAPIPTPPAGCYNIFDNYGFSREGRFTAANHPIRVEVKIGFRLLMCTTTPEGT